MNHARVPRRLLQLLLRSRGLPRVGPPPPSKSIANVEVCPFKYGKEAAACVSVDFELGWAWRFRDHRWLRQHAQLGRKHVPRLITLLEEFSLPVTWAIVGHLFLESCTAGVDGMPHPDMPRPHPFWNWPGDWYFHDPCLNYRDAPLWYAPDLINMILESSVDHEVATHSFSHIDFSPKTCYEELAYAEIKKSISAMQRYSLRPQSLVFPFNSCTERYFEVFANLGIIAVRFADPRFQLSYPQRSAYGVWKIFQTMGLIHPTYYSLTHKADAYIEAARANNQVFHLWLHPSDNANAINTTFPAICELLRKRADLGHIWLTTMGELAEYCEVRTQISFDVHNGPDETKIVLDASKCQTRNDTEISLKVGVNSSKTRVLSGKNIDKLEQLNKDVVFSDSGQSLTVTIPISNRVCVLDYS